jgi:hypothetical protein
MSINRNKLVTSAGALTASALLLLAVPTGTTEATLRRPPMPCIAVRVGVYPVGSGFCPGSTAGLDWNHILQRLDAIAGDRSAGVRSAHVTPA